MADVDDKVTLDLSEVEHRAGKLGGGGQLWEPCTKTDIRRRVMAMDYVNAIHWDQRSSAETKFGDIVAPQSMAVALDYGHGVRGGVRRSSGSRTRRLGAARLCTRLSVKPRPRPRCPSSPRSCGDRTGPARPHR